MSLPPFTQTQAEALRVRGIPEQAALDAGIRSVQDTSDFPDGTPDLWRDHGAERGYLPCLVIPWRPLVHRDDLGADQVVWQMRPDDPPVDKEGRSRKYTFPKEAPSVLNRLRWDEQITRTLLVEGTFQSLAASLYAPEGWNVVGVAGCQNWRKGGLPIPCLMALEGHDVVIIFDADMGRSRDVWEAGQGLANELELTGATVRFARLSGQGKQGLDDLLGARPEASRTGYMERLLVDDRLSRKVKQPTQAAVSASVRQRAQQADADRARREKRPMFDVSQDRLIVLEELDRLLQERFAGHSVFSRGGLLVRRYLNELTAVDVSTMTRLISQVCRSGYPATRTAGNSAWKDQLPETTIMKALTVPEEGSWPVLDQIIPFPLVRQDGTISVLDGYDEQTRTYVRIDPVVRTEIDVPDRPGREDVRSAVKLLTEDLLGDFAFASEADVAGSLALLLGLLVRPWFPIAPLAVVDGNGPASGKGLLLDLISRVVLGEPAKMTTYSPDPEEIRKSITSNLIAGHPLVVWDEAHTIRGTALAQLLTSSVWSDRLLGVSRQVTIPNRGTFVALGNNIRVMGDLSRRVHRIRLEPMQERPQDRLMSTFRHPQIRDWTDQNRSRLLSAALTLVRAWVQAGQPEGEVSFGSFEGWQRVIAGILDHAQVPGFLVGRQAWTDQVDGEGSAWAQHLQWLWDTFGERDFTTHEAVEKLVMGGHTLPQPTLERTMEPARTIAYATFLGKQYSSRLSRPYNGLKLHKVGIRDRASVWMIEPLSVQAIDLDDSVIQPMSYMPETGQHSWQSAHRETNPTRTEPTDSSLVSDMPGVSAQGDGNDVYSERNTDQDQKNGHLGQPGEDDVEATTPSDGVVSRMRNMNLGGASSHMRKQHHLAGGVPVFFLHGEGGNDVLHLQSGSDQLVTGGKDLTVSLLEAFCEPRESICPECGAVEVAVLGTLMVCPSCHPAMASIGDLDPSWDSAW